MTRLIGRFTVAMSLGAFMVAGLAVPAFGAGQAYPAPGFASSNASCVGSALDFGAHYDTTVDDALVPLHGTVGPMVSHDATTLGPGVVGEFNRTLAHVHGSIVQCVA